MSELTKCRECGSKIYQRERRPNGDTQCCKCGYKCSSIEWEHDARRLSILSANDKIKTLEKLLKETTQLIADISPGVAKQSGIACMFMMKQVKEVNEALGWDIQINPKIIEDLIDNKVRAEETPKDDEAYLKSFSQEELNNWDKPSKAEIKL